MCSAVFGKKKMLGGNYFVALLRFQEGERDCNFVSMHACLAACGLAAHPGEISMINRVFPSLGFASIGTKLAGYNSISCDAKFPPDFPFLSFSLSLTLFRNLSLSHSLSLSHLLLHSRWGRSVHFRLLIPLSVLLVCHFSPLAKQGRE